MTSCHGTRILVISHTAHHVGKEGIVGWGPTVRELDALAEELGPLVHVAFRSPGEAPGSAQAYTSARVKPVLVTEAGGETWLSKLEILKRVPEWTRAIAREARSADVIFVRAPASIALVAILWLATRQGLSARKWVKYAGDWWPPAGDPWTYKLQRWLLQMNVHQGFVTVNGRWRNQPSHVWSFLNPSFPASVVAEASSETQGKRLSLPARLLFVGQMVSAKGAGRALQIAAKLSERHVRTLLDMVGDGPELQSLTRKAEALKLGPRVAFHGWLSAQALASLYAKAHFVVLPSETEGWPKVLSEGMAWGAVPISSTISSIPQILADVGLGPTWDPMDVDAFVSAIQELVEHPNRWVELSCRAKAAAVLFTYEEYIARISEMLGLERCAQAGFTKPTGRCRAPTQQVEGPTEKWEGK